MSFDKAASELNAWANVKRAGYEVDREPRQANGRSPDFCVYADYKRCFLEIKTYQESDLALLDDFFNDGIWMDEALLMPGKTAQLRATAEFATRLQTKEGRESLWENRAKVLEDIRAGLDARIRQGPLVNGTAQVGQFAVLQYVDAPEYKEGALDSHLVPSPTQEYEAARVVREIRHARSQLPENGLGFIVVNVPPSIDPDLVRVEIRDALTRDESSWRHVGAVLLGTSVEDEQGETQRAYASLRMAWHQYTDAERAMFRALLWRPRRLVASPPRFGAQRPGVWRRGRGRSVRVRLGQVVSPEPGLSYTFRIPSGGEDAGNQ